MPLHYLISCKTPILTACIALLQTASCIAQNTNFLTGTWRTGTEDDGYLHLVLYPNGTCEMYDDGEMIFGASPTLLESKYDEEIGDDANSYGWATYDVRYCYGHPCRLNLFVKGRTVYTHKKQFNEDGYFNSYFLIEVLGDNKVKLICDRLESSEEEFDDSCEYSEPAVWTRLKKF